MLGCQVANCTAVTTRGACCGGCRQVQQHKWQRLKMALIPARWGKLLGQLFGTTKDCLNTLVAGIAIGTLAVQLARFGLASIH
jgi:hypothetical protein